MIGRARNGIVLLFKSDGEQFEALRVHGATGPFNLVLEATGEIFTVAFDGLGYLDVSAYTWKDRSPLTVSRSMLPTLHPDTGEAVIRAALALGCTWAPSEAEAKRSREQAERIAKLKHEIAQGLHDEAGDEREARADQALVKANPNASPGDGVLGRLVVAARARLADRAKARAAAERRARLAQEA